MSRGFAAGLLAAAVLLSGAAARAAEPHPRRAELDGKRVEELLALAEKAEKAGAFALGFRTRRDAARISGATAPTLPEKADEIAAKKLAGLLGDYRDLAAKQGADLGKLAAELAREGAADAAAAAARAAVALAPDDAKARKVLGHEKAGAYGWRPAADAARIGKAKSPAPGAKIEEFEPVETAHWRVRSDLPVARTAELAALLERFLAKWLDDWDGFLPLREIEKPFEVYIFAEEPAYRGFLARTDPQALSGVPGQYSPTLRRSCFYDVTSKRDGSTTTSSLEELMLHECTHQLMHELAASDMANFEGPDKPNFWLHEGLGELYGMHAAGRDGLSLDVKAVAKTLRTGYVRQNGPILPSVGDFDELGRDEFLGTDMRRRAAVYALSGFVCWYLLEERPAAFRRIVRTAYCEKNRPGLLTGITGLATLDVGRGFGDWFRRF